MDFKLWSELNPKAKKELKPDFGFRKWDSLSEDEKYKIWKYLEYYFFDEENITSKYFLRICDSIVILNYRYKAKSYARNFMEKGILKHACQDFYEIFMNKDEHVVMELLSLYSKVLISEKTNETISKKENETEEEYQNRLQDWRWEDFDKFHEDLNGVFTDFGIDLYLTRQGFMPRQEEKIVKEVYEPVVDYLSNKKWKKVNEILSDSFTDYRRNTPQGYSGCVTKTISAVEAFMQLLVEGKTGGTKLSPLISKAKKEGLIPDDIFTQTIFKNIDSILARERMATGDAHPKKEYATEKNARTMLNLAMIFLQHCIQK